MNFEIEEGTVVSESSLDKNVNNSDNKVAKFSKFVIFYIVFICINAFTMIFGIELLGWRSGPLNLFISSISVVLTVLLIIKSLKKNKKIRVLNIIFAIFVSLFLMFFISWVMVQETIDAKLFVVNGISFEPIGNVSWEWEQRQKIVAFNDFENSGVIYFVRPGGDCGPMNIEYRRQPFSNIINVDRPRSWSAMGASCPSIISPNALIRIKNNEGSNAINGDTRIVFRGEDIMVNDISELPEVDLNSSRSVMMN